MLAGQNVAGAVYLQQCHVGAGKVQRIEGCTSIAPSYTEATTGPSFERQLRTTLFTSMISIPFLL
jgi:hypothetical protein